MNDWTVDPKPVPEDLETTYDAAPYRDPFMTPILEKLSAADRDALLQLMGGWPITPEPDN